MGTVALRRNRHPADVAPRPEPDGLRRPPGPASGARSWRYYLVAGVIVAVLGGAGAVVELPLWRQLPALALANLATSLTFIATGLLLHREPRHRGVAWALILAGVFRPLDFVDAWTGGPWAAYAVVFGAADRVCGAWALLRYPRLRLTTTQRIYLAVLVGWMLVGRTGIVVTSTAQSNGYPASSWWPTLIRDLPLSNVIDIVLNCGEGILGIILLVLLIRRLRVTKGLDRIVIAPIIGAGVAAVIAASATAVAQLFTNISMGPTDAYVVEGFVDLAVPLAFLVAVIQRALLARNLAGLSANLDLS